MASTSTGATRYSSTSASCPAYATRAADSEADAASANDPGAIDSRSRPLADVHVGCSGWNYKAWRDRFYPGRLPARLWLSFYIRHFDTVEVNNTFYRLPEASIFAAWRRQLPAGFVMSVKASRFLTHMKRLREPEEPVRRLLSRTAALGDRLGPILYQLPESFPRDLARLEDFLAVLPPRWRRRPLRHVIEFRNPSWYVSETFRLLERHQIALCLHDKLGSRISAPFVGPFVYVRFHGTSGQYRGSYSARDMQRWAAVLIDQWRDGRPVFAYFNNDPDAAAPANAATLRAMLLKRSQSPTASGRARKVRSGP